MITHFPMKPYLLTLILSLILSPLVAQVEEAELNEEGFKTSTVSDFLKSKYTWEAPKNEEESENVVDNKTPFKPLDQRVAERNEEIKARLQPTLDIDDPAKEESMEDIPLDELGLDTVELREYQVNELYSPLMRMSEIKDLDTLDPASGGVYLADEYYSNLENRWLNRYHIPLIGKSQEQLAQERYRQEQYENFLGDVSTTISGLESLDPERSKAIKGLLNETKTQYNSNYKNDDLRFSGPDAKF